MGRIRGKRNRDNDRFTTARRDAEQAGMVGADPIEVSTDGEFVFTPISLVSSAPQESDALMMAVRGVLRARQVPLIAPEQVTLPKARVPLVGFHADVRFEANHFPVNRPVSGPTTPTGTVFKTLGREVEVESVMNAGELRSRSAFWLWNPERAFRFLHGELFDSYQTPHGRWSERRRPKYADVYWRWATS